MQKKWAAAAVVAFVLTGSVAAFAVPLVSSTTRFYYGNATYPSGMTIAVGS